MKLTHYEQPSIKAWHGRIDTLAHERFFQIIKLNDLTSEKPIPFGNPGFALMGFCSDTGIKRNQGRVGARSGPASLRRYFGTIALPPKADFSFYDFGDIHCDDGDLEKAQEELASLVSTALKHDLTPLIIGGGHELSWPGFLGTATTKAGSIGIINFDAHFDLRPIPPEGANSGTSFTQIAEYCARNNSSFNYLVLGLQMASSTSSLLERARKLNTRYVSADQIHEEGLEKAIAWIDSFIAHNDHIYLTICLDVFAEAFAPGVSAPQALGLTPWQILPLLKRIIMSGKVAAFDIAELSPPLDEANKTSRLCAALLYELIKNISLIA